MVIYPNFINYNMINHGLTYHMLKKMDLDFNISRLAEKNRESDLVYKS